MFQQQTTMDDLASLESFDQQYDLDALMGGMPGIADFDEDKHNNFDEVKEEEFVDAPEHQDTFEQPMEDIAFEHPNTDDGDLNISPSTLSDMTQSSNYIGQRNDQFVADAMEEYAMEDKGQGESPQNRSKKHQTRYDPTTEIKEIISVNKSAGQGTYAAAYQAAISKTPFSSQGQHCIGCSGAPGASTPTPPPSKPPSPQLATGTGTGITSNSQKEAKSTSEEKVWLGPDDLRDVSKILKREQNWHNKVAFLHPADPLRSHRYWIGVLKRGLKMQTASKEEHFTWMKGNRFTTVETVRKNYELSDTLDGGVLIIGGEKPNDEDRVEEFDLCNDKIVLFRIAGVDTPQAAGSEATKGLVPDEEIIVLDD